MVPTLLFIEVILSLSCDANNFKVTDWRSTVLSNKEACGMTPMVTIKAHSKKKNTQIARNKVLLNEAHSIRIEWYLNYNTIFKTNKHI